MFRSCVHSFSTLSFNRISTSIRTTRTLQNKRCVMMSTLSGNLVSVEDCLAAHENRCGNNDTIFIDGSWHLSPDRDGREEYEKGPRIAGSKFFDIDDVASKGSELNPKGLPHMMPPKVGFKFPWNFVTIF